MKLKKLYYGAAAILAVCLTQSVLAWPDMAWMNYAGDGLWNNGLNWTNETEGGTGVPPILDVNVQNVTIDPNNGGSCTIPTGVVEAPGTGLTNATWYWYVTNGDNSITTNSVAAAYGSLFGPEWGMHLEIYGTLNFNWVLGPVGTSVSAPSLIDMYNGSVLTNTSIGAVGGNLGLGDNWWWQGGPYVTMNMYGNAKAYVQALWWGGNLNIYDTAVFTCTGVNDRGAGAVGAVSDATRSLDLIGGTLVLPTGKGSTDFNVTTNYWTTFVTNWINRGIFLCYGKAYDTNADGSVKDFSIIDNGINTTVTVPVLGALQSISLNPPVRSTMMAGTIQPVPTALGNFQNVTGVPLNVLDAAQSPGTVVYSSSNPSVVSTSVSGMLTALKPGTATISGSIGAASAANSYLITVTPFTNSLVHEYRFSESSGTTAADSVPGNSPAWDGTLNGGASFNGSGQVVLDGVNGYVQLPAGIVTNMDAVTVEAWVNFGPQSAWACLFAFGNSDAAIPANGENYIAFQPFTGLASPTANTMFGAGDPGNANEQDATLPLVSGGVTNLLGNVHVACVYNPYGGYVALYTNGVLAVINNNVNSVSPGLASVLGTGGDPLNYIGESLYGADPWLNAAIDEFRIYNGALTAPQIAADQALGPNQLIGTSTSVSLKASLSAGNVVLSWPTTSALVDVMSSPALGSAASWTSVNSPLTVVGGNYQMTVPATSSAKYFRLTQY